jgi:hypothetical protein
MSEEPVTATMNDENKPAAVVEVVGSEGSLGQWTVSTWFTKFPWIGLLRREMGSSLGRLLYEPQSFRYRDRAYELALRPVRYYKPYSIHLIDFTHDRYKGTEIPKNFSSHIHLQNAATGENREILVYMNNPLRYAGETYYQGSFEEGDRTSILHVVRNPAWLTPYLSCALVAIGLVVQFLSHLIGFGKRSAARAIAKPEAAKPRPSGKVAVQGEPVGVSTAGRNGGATPVQAAKRRIS